MARTPGFDPSFDAKVSRLFALAHFANDYHSGMGSRGYRLLCRALRRLKAYGFSRPIDWALDDSELEMYGRLAASYANRI